MKRLIPAAVLVLVLSLPAVAATDAPPTDASLKELIELVHGARMLESMRSQVDTMMSRAMHDALAGRPISAEQQKTLDDMHAQILVVVNDVLQWDKFEPMMLDIYKQSFSQREIDGMIAFYKTDTGRAVIDKMPVVMQNTMLRAQELMKDVAPRLQKIQHDSIAKLSADHGTAAEPSK
jgi:hypothetical protein